MGAYLRSAATNPWVRFVVVLALVVAAAVLFLDGLDVSGVLEEVRGASPLYIAAAVLVYALSWYPRGLRYRDILAATGYGCSTAVMTGAVFVSQTANLVAPARAGDATRAYIVKKRSGVPYPTGVASLTAERFLDVVAVGGLATAGAGVALLVGDGGPPSGPGGGSLLVGSALLVAAVVGGVAALVLASRADLGNLHNRLPFVTEGVADLAAGFADDVAAIFEDARALAGLLATSVAAWGLDVASGALVLYSVGVTGWVAVPAALLGVGAGNLAKAVPSTPGGIGVYEAGFAASVTALLPVGWEAAVAVAVVDHAVKNGVTVVGGVVSATVLNVSLTRGYEDEADSAPH